MNHYKFIHIFWGKDTKFTPELVKAINDPEGHFVIEDHLFVTCHQSLFDYLSHFNNVVLDISNDCMLNKYAPYCDCLFCHGLPSNRELLKLKRQYKKKIIVRNWGGNKTIKNYSKGYLGNISLFISNTITKIYFNLRYGSFAGMGIANIVDEIDIRKMNKRIPLCVLNYESKEVSHHWQSIISKTDKKEGKTRKIMVGHRGTRGENHFNMMKLLKKYESFDIEVVLVLSYGDSTYIEELKKKVNDLWAEKEKLCVIDKFMPIVDYYKLLNEIDIAIFDEERSSALGNIMTLLSLNKKIFLNKEGVIKEGFDKEGIPYRLTSEISEMSFEDFIKPLDYSKCEVKSLYIPFDKKIDKYYSDLHETFRFAETL
jgi:hypothetical protein